MLYSLKNLSESEVAKKRIKIIRFYEEYGEKATKEAFGADRRVISRWRKRMREKGEEGLNPYSTRPYKLRQMTTDKEIIGYIRMLREKHPRIGKEKIKVMLDRFCELKGLKSISASTIGKIIKRNNFFYQPNGRVYHNPDSKWAIKRTNKPRRKRVRYSPKVDEYGHIMSDTVERITDGIKDYFISAIDIKQKFAITLNYKRLTSRNMLDFYRRFKEVYPYKIKSWQTDNGRENLGEFDAELKREGIEHRFTYPRCPRINSYIERYNRTIQEEFIDNNLDIIHDKELLNKRLAEYLIYYNIERPQKSLNMKAPLELILKDKMSQMCVTHTFT